MVLIALADSGEVIQEAGAMSKGRRMLDRARHEILGGTNRIDKLIVPC